MRQRARTVTSHSPYALQAVVWVWELLVRVGVGGVSEQSLVYFHTIIRPPDLHGQFSPTLNAQQGLWLNSRGDTPPQQTKTELHPSILKAPQVISATLPWATKHTV